jgi:hypothetical protein
MLRSFNKLKMGLKSSINICVYVSIYGTYVIIPEYVLIFVIKNIICPLCITCKIIMVGKNIVLIFRGNHHIVRPGKIMFSFLA